VSKKLILITAVIAIISFGATFALGWLTQPAPVITEQLDSNEISQPLLYESSLLLPQQSDVAGSNSNIQIKTMTENQLKDLIYEVREKIKLYDDKLQSLNIREERVQKAHDSLNEDIKTLNNLQVELASTILNIRTEMENLEKRQIQIEQSEKANLKKTAASFDKMEPARVCDMIINMCLAQVNIGSSNTNTLMNDAVMILYYMQDRSRAAFFEELVKTEPKLAAVLIQKLKQVSEVK
jgi:hypothetical protein